MIDFGRRFHVGMASVSSRCAALGGLILRSSDALRRFLITQVLLDPKTFLETVGTTAAFRFSACRFSLEDCSAVAARARKSREAQ